MPITPPSPSCRRGFMPAAGGHVSHGHQRRHRDQWRDLGGAFITNNAAFAGQWTELGSLTNGQCVVNRSDVLGVDCGNPAAALADIHEAKLALRPIPAHVEYRHPSVRPDPAGPYNRLPGATSPGWSPPPTANNTIAPGLAISTLLVLATTQI